MTAIVRVEKCYNQLEELQNLLRCFLECCDSHTSHITEEESWRALHFVDCLDTYLSILRSAMDICESERADLEKALDDMLASSLQNRKEVW